MNPLFWTKLGYNALFALFFAVVSLPYVYKTIRRGRSGRGFMQRFGMYGPATLKRLLALRGAVWIHAVSVGEAGLASLLIKEARSRWPALPIILTTTTPTGKQVAVQQVPEDVPVAFNPLDFFFSVRWTFMCLQPRAIVLVESEIWPNYMWEAARRQVPVVLINARLSSKTEGRYHKLGWFVRPFLRQLEKVCVQNSRDHERYRALGVDPARLADCGSMKYDVCKIRGGAPGFDPREILRTAGWHDGAPILLAGSTHPGEEKFFAKLWLELREEFPDLYLVLAPRHAERGREIAGQLRSLGIDHKRRSKLKEPSHSNRVLVLDTTGELRAFYPLATVTFVGKSLLGRGGQNFLEPVQSGSPVVFGPHMQNFEPMASEFVMEGAVARIPDKDHALPCLQKLLRDSGLRQTLSSRALQLYESKLGATRRTVDVIAPILTRPFELPEDRERRKRDMNRPAQVTDDFGI